MIILFGKKGCRKTHIEKHSLEAAGKRVKFYDIDSPQGKEALRKRGLFYDEIKKNTPISFVEED